MGSYKYDIKMSVHFVVIVFLFIYSMAVLPTIQVPKKRHFGSKRYENTRMTIEMLVCLFQSDNTR